MQNQQEKNKKLPQEAVTKLNKKPKSNNLFEFEA